MTSEEKELELSLRELANALVERDYFYGNVKGWGMVHLYGNCLEMKVTDGEVIEAMRRACSEYVERRVAKAKERLKRAQGGC